MNVKTTHKVIQVFEHEKLRIGEVRQGVKFEESHWKPLLKLNEKQYPPFFKVIHQGIQFSSFVGILSIPSLTIEVLSKADANVDRPGVWRNWLMEILLACEQITPYAVPAASQLRQNDLLYIWLHQFLKAVEHLLQQGLLKKYQMEESNQPALRGKLLFSKNIRQNLVHQERFYTRYASYDEAHYFHQMIGAALTCVEHASCKMKLREKARYLRGFLPECKTSHIFPEHLPKSQYNRQTIRYRPALELAYLILSHFSPILKAGDQTGLAIMFDMNQLYEEYIYRQLYKAARKRNLCLHKQVSTRFWAQRSLRPDMVLHAPQSGAIILDTKWKVLPLGQPAEEDIKQIYIYNHYFKAQRGVLLYPQVSSQYSYRKAYHQPEDQKLFCEVHFVNVLDRQQRLNGNVGEEILAELGF